MSENSEEAVGPSEINDRNNDRRESSICSSDNASGTADSGSRTNLGQCEVGSSSKLSTTRDDELRDEMITALAWAIRKTFTYQPSDPIHYMAHQLLRWRYGDVSERIPTITINSGNEYFNDAREDSSSSFCPNNCEDSCNEQSSEREIPTSQ